ncbi:hypothetical protein QQF64_016827 [Cirrhinus molitorella]|uniref:Uncharacterized protein n=1 Tax=Cirrhinus molitorella TaxID=172907 RepID=A0ABR3LT24_9TELE
MCWSHRYIQPHWTSLMDGPLLLSFHPLLPEGTVPSISLQRERDEETVCVLASCKDGPEEEHYYASMPVILLDRMQRLGTWVVGTQYPQSLGKPEWEKDECVTRTPSTNSHHTPALHGRGAPYTLHITYTEFFK